jgi:hypothetical protein
MLSLKDLNELLEKIPLWKKMTQAPDRIDALEQRIVDLERKLSGDGAACPFCHGMTGQLEDIEPMKEFDGLTEIHHYRCSSCQRTFRKKIDL